MALNNWICRDVLPATSALSMIIGKLIRNCLKKNLVDRKMSEDYTKWTAQIFFKKKRPKKNTYRGSQRDCPLIIDHIMIPAEGIFTCQLSSFIYWLTSFLVLYYYILTINKLEFNFNILIFLIFILRIFHIKKLLLLLLLPLIC